MTMGFELRLTPAEEVVRERLHAIARSDFRARAAEAERDGVDLSSLTAQLEEVGLSPAQILAHGLPELHTLLVAVEEMAYGDPGIAWAAVTPLQVALLVGACGSETLRERVGVAFAENPSVMSSLLLHEDFGRAPSEFQTTVTASGEGWKANGRKTSAAHPGFADVTALVARDAGGALAGFVWTGARDGISAERDDRLVGKLALTAVPSGPVSIAELELSPDEQLSGGIELHRAVAGARLFTAAALVGTARASMEFCAGYALERTTWGKPIAEYQGVSFPIIEHSTEIEEVRLLLWDAAARLGGAGEIADTETLVGRALNRASGVALHSTRDGVQLIGVRGITRDLPCERWYRSAGVLAAVDFDPLLTPFGVN
jgi:alkylation response protein AidB-like acyl-CoA dehydrogenase